MLLIKDYVFFIERSNDLENEIRILNKAIEVLSKKKPGKEDWFEKRLAKLS